MRCYICDHVLAEPTFNRDYETWEPCKECLEAIEDTLAAFRDRPSVDEDELFAEDLSDQLNLPLHNDFT